MWRAAALAVALSAFMPADAGAERITLDAAAPTSPMPETFSVSTWPFDPLISPTLESRFFEFFRPGLIQFDLGEHIFSKSASETDAIVRVEEVARLSREVLRRGGRVMVSISKIPPWLSSSADLRTVAPGEGTSIAAASPPADPDRWAAFLRNVAAAFPDDAGLSFRIGWEPDTKTWQADAETFFDFYDDTAHAIRQVRPGVRIGGPGVSDLGPHWQDPDGPPMLERFLSHVAQSGAPLDFVALHAFSASPWTSWKMYRERVGGMLAAAGLDPGLPIFVGEWSDQPDPFSAFRETPGIAAYIVANLVAMDAAGIELHSYTSLTDQQSGGDDEFAGGFGLFTRSLVLRPSGLAFALVDRLGDRRLPLSVEDGEVFAVAGRRGDVTTLLIANYVPDERIAVKDYVDQMRLRGVGNTALAGAAGGQAGLRDLAAGRSRPSGGALAAAHDASRAAVAGRMAEWSEGAHGPREITVDIRGLSGRDGDTARALRIDSEHGNPASAARDLNRRIAKARRGADETAIVAGLRGAGFGDADIQLIRGFAGARDKAGFLSGLDAGAVRSVMRAATVIRGIEEAAALSVADAALRNPSTGLTVSQQVPIGGQSSVEFDIRMEPNSVVLLEFGGAG